MPNASLFGPGGLVRRGWEDRKIRYLVAGGVSAVVYYSAFSAGWLLFGGYLNYLVLTLIASVGSAIATYPLYRIHVFRTAGPWVTGFLKFYSVILGSLFYAFAGLPLLIEVVGLNVLVAQAIIVVTTPLINYQVHRFWAFRDRKPAE